MEKTDRETMEEIIGGYTGKNEYEDTLASLGELTALIKEFFSAAMQIIEEFKSFLAEIQK